MTNQMKKRFLKATDGSEMASRFQKQLSDLYGRSISFNSFYITRAFPRKKGGFSVQYEILSDDLRDRFEGKFILWGHLLGPLEGIPSYIKSHAEQSFYLEDIRLCVPVFPFDPKLKRLRDYCDINDRVKEALKGVPELSNDDFEVTDVELLAYRLERRCVLLYKLRISEGRSVRDMQLVAKVGRPGYASSALEVNSRILNAGIMTDGDGRFSIPRVYGTDIGNELVIMERAPGESIHMLIDKPELPSFCSRAGDLIRRFHKIESGSSQAVYTADDELSALDERISSLESVSNPGSDTFRDAFERLIGQKPVLDENPVTVHRDFHDKQVLIAPDRVTILDYDNMTVSDPALDFGNFMAHLDLRALQFPGNSNSIEGAKAAFRAGYGKTDGHFSERASWWAAATSLRLAVLYSFRPRWRDIASNLVERAELYMKSHTFLSRERV